MMPVNLRPKAPDAARKSPYLHHSLQFVERLL
jgi:hypothetical protein